MNEANIDGELPDVEKIKINVQKEILKLAQRDGITDIKYLELDVVLRRRDYYAATVKTYYEGYDNGFADAAAKAASNLTKAEQVLTEMHTTSAEVTRKAVKRARATYAAGGAIIATLCIVGVVLLQRLLH